MCRCYYEPYNNSNNNYSFHSLDDDYYCPFCDDDYCLAISYDLDIDYSGYSEYYNECDLLEKHNLAENLDLNFKLARQSLYNQHQKKKNRDIHKLFWKKQLAKRYLDNINPLTKASTESLARVSQKRSKDKRKSQKRGQPILVE